MSDKLPFRADHVGSLLRPLPVLQARAGLDGGQAAAEALVNWMPLQFDDVNLAYLCDRDSRARIRSRGDDPYALLQTWVDTVNMAIGDRPSDMVITMHICRGNFRSDWLAQGGYEPIADALFNEFDYEGYFLEYDSARAGSFDPL